MAKSKKEPKKREEKYNAKLAINATFEEAMKIIVSHVKKEDKKNKE
jgi:hypothetical protein